MELQRCSAPNLVWRVFCHGTEDVGYGIRVVTSCGPVGDYQGFGSTYRLHLEAIFLRKVGSHTQNCTASQPIRAQHKFYVVCDCFSLLNLTKCVE